MRFVRIDEDEIDQGNAVKWTGILGYLLAHIAECAECQNSFEEIRKHWLKEIRYEVGGED